MKRLIIIGMSIGLTITMFLVIVLAMSDFQSATEIVSEGQDVMEAAKEGDTKKFNDEFRDWFVNVVFPILLIGTFLSVIVGFIFGKK